MGTAVSLAELLAEHRGITAVVGSGGKSTLLAQGGRALAEQGARVVLATTTHMLPPEGIPLVRTLDDLDGHRIAAIGELDSETGKLSCPACGIDALAGHADYALVEADGSHRLPLKAHAGYEPVIPAEAARTILVVGASGFDRPIAEAVHRPQTFCELTGAALEDPATPELVARAIAAEGLVGEGGDDLVIVNQVEGEDALAEADELAGALSALMPGISVYAGSLRRETLVRLA